MRVKEHWEQVYTTKPTNGVSWFQEHAELSLCLIRETGVSGAIIDVGGGASTLVDDLLNEGYRDPTVLDVSSAALAAARKRLGTRAESVTWIEADILAAKLPSRTYDVWHDRAVFHFLTEPSARATYVETVLRTVKPGGYVIVATFAEDGPTKCSGLPVARYRADELHAEFGDPFTLLRHEKESHRTPFGTVQQFVYCHCLKNPDPEGGSLLLSSLGA
jgi:ubiquinone/menaquinone biosynthesis C-methylase UbiE